MRGVALALVIAAAAAAATFTATRSDDVRLQWFELGGCSGADYTGLVIGVGLCQLIPGAAYPAYGAASFRVICNGNTTGDTGALQFFSDSTCVTPVSTSGVSRPFSSNTCYGNPPEFGALSLLAECSNPVLPPAEPLAGRATVLYSSTNSCDASSPRTLVDVNQGFCQTVPSSTPGGYRVTCAADGSFAALDVYENNLCTAQVSHRILSRDVCASNAGTLYGAPFIAVRCSALGTAGAPPAVNDPNASPSPSRAPQPGLGAPIPSSSASTSSAPTYLPNTTPSSSPLAATSGAASAVLGGVLAVLPLVLALAQLLKAV